jgi:Fe-S-cluster containining protein
MSAADKLAEIAIIEIKTMAKIAIDRINSMTMNPCDTCSSPGACCKEFPLSHHKSYWMDDVGWESSWQEILDDHNLTFFYPVKLRYVDIAIVSNTGEFRAYGQPLTSCHRLGADGRCTDYENRPEFPCKAYPPMHDKLCVEWRKP